MGKKQNGAHGGQPASPAASDAEAVDAKLAVWCTACLQDYMRGNREKAKKVLIKLASEHESYVPHRYLARLFYHEAAVLEALQTAEDTSAGRLQLLKQALDHATIGSARNPHSLSIAALRATLVVNVLVEESSLCGTNSAGEADSTAAAELIKKQFKTAISSCSIASASPTPTMAEPVININDDGQHTCDPCSLRVQEQILQWVREGRWDCVVQEKRNVLVCMQQVLQSCHTLLDSTQIPVDGVVRLLQHILRSLLPHRPMQHDLQVWASQLLGTPGASSPDAQLLLQAQQTLLQQGHQLQPASQQAPAQPASQQGQPAYASSGAVPSSAAKASSLAMQHGAATPAAKSKQPVASLPAAPQPAAAKEPVVEAPALSLPLFEEREWDWDKELGGSPAGGSTGGASQPAAPAAPGGVARRRTRAKPHGKPVAANPRSCKERSRRERYTDVEAFWCSLQPEQRMELLRVPLAPLLQRMRQEVGQDVVEDVCEGLVLLQEQGTCSSCLWTCVMCDQKFTHSKDFLQHIEVAHEEVAVQGGKYVMCGKCAVEVVGMYYTSTCVADYSLCARCFQQELTSVPEISSAYERIYPRVPSVNGPQRWSDTGSDFISTRDSFTSAEELDQLQGPATPKAMRLENSSHWSSPLRQAGLGSSGRPTLQPGDKPLGLPAWASSAQQRQQPASRQHSRTSSTSSGAASPASAPAAHHPSPQRYAAAEARAQQQQREFSSGPQSSGAAAATAASPVAAFGDNPEPRSASCSDIPRSGVQLHPGDVPGGDSGGLLSSWWPRRLLQSWNSGGQPQQQQQPDKRHGSSGKDTAGGGSGGADSAAAGSGSSGSRGSAFVRSACPSPEPAPPTPQPAGSHVAPASSSEQHTMSGSKAGWTSSLEESKAEQQDEEALDGPGRSSKVRRTSSQGSAGSTATSVPQARAGPGACCGADVAAGVGGCAACTPGGAVEDGLLEDDLDAVSMAMLCSSERRQLVVVVDEIMQRIRDIYGSNHTIGDMALGSIMQFTERKLSALLKQHILPSEAPSVRQQLEEFLAQPACVFRKPEVLRGTLRCLPVTDLHMVLVYVVRQHADALAGADGDGAVGPHPDGDGDGELGTEAPAGAQYARMARAAGAAGHQRARRQLGTGEDGELGGEAGAPAGRAVRGPEADDGEDGDGEEEEASLESTCVCDEEEEVDEGEEEEEEEEEDDVAPPPLFELHVPNMTALHELIADVWQRDEEEGGDADGGGAPGSSGGGAGSAGPLSVSAGGTGGRIGRASRREIIDVDDFVLMAGLQLEGFKPSALDRSIHPWMAPTDWWMTHLLEHPPTTPTPTLDTASKASPTSTASTNTNRRANNLRSSPMTLDKDGGVRRLLQWVFGKVVNTAAEEFLTRQREYRAGREREAALLDLYDDLAYGWRSLQAALDQRARLEELRKGARAQFAVVRHIEEEARHCHAEEAAEFLEVLMSSHQAALTAATEAGGATDHPRLNMCEAAVDVVRRHPALAGEPSQRYARALLDRELSALLLVEAMLAAEVDEAGRARGVCEDTLRKHRSEVRDTEGEYTRLEAEGPACHRKKDLLDKATKEAEHRERIQDLSQRLIAVTEKISNEEQSKTKWNERLAEAERDLRAVRDQLRQHSTRRKHLDELCAQLEVPMPPALMLQQQQQQGAALNAPLPSSPHRTGDAPAPAPAPSPAAAATSPAPPPAASSAISTATPAAAEGSPPPAGDASRPPVTPPSTPPADVPSPLPASAPAPAPTSPPKQQHIPATPPTATLSPSSPASLPAFAPPLPVLPPPLVMGGSEGDALALTVPAAALTLEEWHKQRLEVLMYRLMWVSEAVKNFQDQYSPHARTRHYELFLKATGWAKSLADEYETQVRGWYNELDKLRDKLLEQACVDLGLIMGQHTLDIVRRRIESGARMAQEKASLLLLRELELEESSAKTAAAGAGGPGSAGAVGAGWAAGAGGAGAAGGGKNAAKNATKKQKSADKAKEKKDREEAERQARAAEADARRRAEEDERLRLIEARRAREAAIEAELERRRKELEALEATREAEAIRAAQEASLKEAARAATLREEKDRAAAAAAEAKALQHRQQQQQQAAAAAARPAAPFAAAAAAASSPVAAPAAVAATVATSNGRVAGVPRNGNRRVPAVVEGPVAKAVAPAQAGGVDVVSPALGTAGRAAATKPAAAQQAAVGRQAAGREAAAAQPQRRASAVTAAAVPAATAAVEGAVAPRPANKHAPKFTSPAAMPASQAARSAAYGMGGRVPASAGDATPRALHQQPSGRTSSGGARSAAHTNGPVPHDTPPTAAHATAAPGLHQRGIARLPQPQPPAAVLAGGSPAAKPPAAALAMPQTPEQRPLPAGSATIPHLYAAAPAPTVPTFLAPSPRAMMVPVMLGMAQTPPASASGTQHSTPRQLDLLSSMFNPFAENPLLRALQPERGASPALGVSNGSLLPPQLTPHHSHLTSPRSPGDHLSSPTLTPPLPSTGGAYSNFNHHHHLHHHLGSPTMLPPAPATPSSAAEPATDHILSIMSILEPDSQSSPVAPYAFKSQGSSLGGSGSAGGSANQHPQATAGHSLQAQRGGLEAGDQQEGSQHTTPRQPTHKAVVPGQHMLPGLTQPSGYSIWSSGAATDYQTAEDAWAMHGAGSGAGGSTPASDARRAGGGRAPRNAKPVVSMLSSSAAPWTGGASSSSNAGPLGGHQSSSSQHASRGSTTDMASLLPASLLPASLEADAGPTTLRGPERAGAKSLWPGSGIQQQVNGGMQQGNGVGMRSAAGGQGDARGPAAPWMADSYLGLLGSQNGVDGHAGGMLNMGAKPGPGGQGLLHPYLHPSMLPDTLWPGYGPAGPNTTQQGGQGQASFGGWPPAPTDQQVSSWAHQH